VGARVLAFAAVAAAGVLGVAGGVAGSNSTSYTDPAGDSANAPDLTGIAISNDDAGKITFAVSYGNRPGGLNDQDQVQIWIDSIRTDPLEPRLGPTTSSPWTRGARL
jgi:hypothetical protein